jgi:hypothetical protein
MLRNYNNYKRDHANWAAAAANQAKYQHAAQMANNQNVQAHKDLMSGQPGFNPNGRMEIDSMYAKYTPLEQEANKHHMNMMNAASHAMNNEMTQVQERKMDLADNEQGRKNLQTEYDRATQMEKIRAAERMNNRNNQGLEGLMDGMNTAFSGVSPEQMQVPNYDLYSNNGNRMGGSYFGKALLG